jgi:hypothetical protein
MNENILNTIDRKYQQLIKMGVTLAHTVEGLMDCSPELINNVHAKKAYDIAKEWNQIAIDIYEQTFSREGK